MGDNCPVKKAFPVFALPLAVLGLASCSTGGSTSSTYVPPKPLLVSFYDDSPEPVLVGTAYCRPGTQADPTFQGYDFLSNDPELELLPGEHAVFRQFEGTYEDGTPVDLTSVKEDCCVYSVFAKEIYKMSFRYYNGSNLIRDEESVGRAAITTTMEWGKAATRTGENPPSSVLKEGGDYGVDYLFDGWTVKGHPEAGILPPDLGLGDSSLPGALAFSSFDTVPPSKGEVGTFYLDISKFDESGEPLYPVYVHGEEDYSLISLGSLAENALSPFGLLIELEAHFAESPAVHEVMIVTTGDSITGGANLELIHGSSIEVSKSISPDEGEYRIDFSAGGETFSFSAPLTEGKELAYEALYTKEAEPHLVGRSVDLSFIQGPVEITVSLKESKHMVNVYDGDVYGNHLGSFLVSPGTNVEADFIRGSGNIDFSVAPMGGEAWIEHRVEFAPDAIPTGIAWRMLDEDDYLSYYLDDGSDPASRTIAVYGDISLFVTFTGSSKVEIMGGLGGVGGIEKTIEVPSDAKIMLGRVIYDEEVASYEARLLIGINEYQLSLPSSDPGLGLSLVEEKTETGVRIYLGES